MQYIYNSLLQDFNSKQGKITVE